MAPFEEQAANGITDGRAAGVGAPGDRVALAAQPIREQPALGRFAGAVEAVQRDKWAGGHG
jgi:hypothetical protein